jgi:Acetyltransferase (GNAT) family
MKALLAYIFMTITYPFDTSINHTHMAKFQQRIRSRSPQHHQHSHRRPTPAKERWELEALYIHPQHQRHGYGSLALQWGIETARKEDVEIWVWSTQAGKRLYLNSGFEIVGRIGFEDLVAIDDISFDGETRQQEERLEEGTAVWAMIWKKS